MLLKLFAHIDPACGGGSFLGFPKWNKYLHTHPAASGSCDVQLESLNSVWAIAAAIFEMLLRLGSIAAVVFIIWGAFSVIMSQGEPERTKQGKGTIINAIIGLIVTFLAATIVSVIAGRLT